MKKAASGRRSVQANVDVPSGRWVFLAQSSARTGLVLRDLNNDGRTDVETAGALIPAITPDPGANISIAPYSGHELPDVRNQNVATATSTLQAAGYPVAQHDVESCEITPGTVVTQDQPPGVAVGDRGGNQFPTVDLGVAVMPDCDPVSVNPS